MVALQGKLQRIEEHKMDILLGVMELEGKQGEYFRETFIDEGAEVSMQIKSIEPKEGFEIDETKNQEMHEDTPSNEAWKRNLEEIVSLLQETTRELEEQLKLDSDWMKGNEPKEITE